MNDVFGGALMTLRRLGGIFTEAGVVRGGSAEVEGWLGSCFLGRIAVYRPEDMSGPGGGGITTSRRSLSELKTRI